MRSGSPDPATPPSTFHPFNLASLHLPPPNPPPPFPSSPVASGFPSFCCISANFQGNLSSFLRCIDLSERPAAPTCFHSAVLIGCDREQSAVSGRAVIGRGLVVILLKKN